MKYFIRKMSWNSASVDQSQTSRPWITFCKKLWNSHFTADISLLLVALIWGTTFVATKNVITTVPVFQFLCIRFGLTSLLMLPLNFKAIRQADRQTWMSGTLFGLFLLTIFSLETFGVANTSASNAGFIISLFAVMVPIIELLIYRRMPKIGLVIAVLLSLVGTALLTIHEYRFTVNIGDWLVLGAALCRAIQMILTKTLTEGKNMNSGALISIQLAVVAIGSGILTLTNHSPISELTPSFWLITGYLAVFATMFAFFIQLIMIRRTSPSRVALLMSSEPIFAALFSVWLLGEQLSVAAMIGGICIVAGMLWGRKSS